VAMALMRFYFSFPLSDTTTRNEFNLVEKFLKQSACAGALSKMKAVVRWIALGRSGLFILRCRPKFANNRNRAMTRPAF